MSDASLIDYHYTPTEMDLAREMKESGLNWPYGVGDCFCASEDQMYVCVNTVEEGSTIWVEAAQQKMRFPLEEVVWLPKRTQCIQWLKERNWRLKFKTQGNNHVIEALGGEPSSVPLVEGFGRTEFESLYGVIGQIAQLESGGF
jgi:hypothetical protein